MSQPALDRAWDPGLQPERTALAWRRYCLAALALGLLMPRVVWPVLGPWSLPAAAFAVITTLVIFQRTLRRYRRVHQTLITSPDPVLPDGRTPLLAVVVHLVLGILALGALALTLVR